MTDTVQKRCNVRKVAGSLLWPLASFVAINILSLAVAWLLGSGKGPGKFVLHQSQYFVVLLPAAVMCVVWWRRGFSFWQTTFSGFVWYFFMYALVCVGFGAGHGLFSTGWERWLRDLGMIALTGTVMCLPIALASSGAFHTVKSWATRDAYDEHARPGLLAAIGWKGVVEYAVAVGFSVLGLMAGYRIYDWLVAAGVGGYTLRLYYDVGHPIQLFGIPFGATAGVLLFNWIFRGRSRVRVRAVALSFVAGLGGVMALSMLAVWFWTGSLKGDAINILVASFLCVVGYNYMAAKREQGE